MKHIEEDIYINNAQGLHARPAAMFVQIANKFNSSVYIAKDGEVVDGKSIITILSLGASRGSKVRLIVEGDDANQALDELKEFLQNENE